MNKIIDIIAEIVNNYYSLSMAAIKLQSILSNKFNKYQITIDDAKDLITAYVNKRGGFIDENGSYNQQEFFKILRNNDVKDAEFQTKTIFEQIILVKGALIGFLSEFNLTDKDFDKLWDLYYEDARSNGYFIGDLSESFIYNKELVGYAISSGLLNDKERNNTIWELNSIIKESKNKSNKITITLEDFDLISDKIINKLRNYTYFSIYDESDSEEDNLESLAQEIYSIIKTNYFNQDYYDKTLIILINSCLMEAAVPPTNVDDEELYEDLYDLAETLIWIVIKNNG